MFNANREAGKFVKWWQDEGHAYYDEMIQPLTNALGDAYVAGTQMHDPGGRVHESIVKLCEIVLAARELYIMPSAANHEALRAAILRNHTVVDRLVSDNIDETYTVLRGQRIIARLLGND